MHTGLEAPHLGVFERSLPLCASCVRVAHKEGVSKCQMLRLMRIARTGMWCNELHTHGGLSPSPPTYYPEVST